MEHSEFFELLYCSGWGKFTNDMKELALGSAGNGPGLRLSHLLELL